MFSDLPISPTFTFGSDGAEVLTVHADASNAVYIDGEKVWDYDSVSNERLMELISDNTKGNLAAYGSAEAVYDKRTGESLYNEDLPEDPTDIIFADQLTTIRIRGASDLQKLDSADARNAEYLQVRVVADDINEGLVQDFAGPDVDIFKLIT